MRGNAAHALAAAPPAPARQTRSWLGGPYRAENRARWCSGCCPQPANACQPTGEGTRKRLATALSRGRLRGRRGR
jgi:hypothetical protein